MSCEVSTALPEAQVLIETGWQRYKSPAATALRLGDGLPSTDARIVEHTDPRIDRPASAAPPQVVGWV